MRSLTVLVGLASVAIVAASCGGTDTTASNEAATSAAVESLVAPSSGDGAFPVTVASGDSDSTDEVVIDARPEAIVSLSPTATEMLFAVGAGDQVVAVDDQSDYPEDVPVTDLSGFEPNVEAILGYAPDLVIAASDPGELVAGLDAAGIPVLLLPSATDLDDTYAQIERVGAATGHIGDAAELVGQMQADIAEILAEVPAGTEQLTYYHELDDTFYSVTGDTFIGAVYASLGLTSIADAAGSDAYPQLSQEFIVSADPDVIFLADTQCCGVTPEQVAARPGWAGMSAVTGARVYPVDEDVASRWGPRVVDFLRSTADQVATLQPAG